MNLECRSEQRARGRTTKILFIHQNFPGQFRRIAAHVARDANYEVRAIGRRGCPQLAGVPTLTYAVHRASAPATHLYAKPFEAGILRGQAVLRLLQQLRAGGFAPDVIIAHAGWGETMFVKDVFPDVRLVHFSEYYYHARGADVGFDPEFPASLDDRARFRAKNALHLLALENCDVAVSPTHWQKSLHPSAYHDKIQVVHEGVDTSVMHADAGAKFTLPDGTVLTVGDPVITYVARHLEPYRGFHVFMRALTAILAQHPGCIVVIVGGDGTGYGRAPAGAPHWRAKMLAEVDVDPQRVHFLGQIPYALYRSLLQVSAVHVYLTYPFVLSWSMLEAMACGCLVIGSRTAPVCEVIKDGENGMLVDFFDGVQLANKIGQALRGGERFTAMRSCAMQTVQERYSATEGVLAYTRLIERSVQLLVSSK